jgi:hypothetical protein
MDAPNTALRGQDTTIVGRLYVAFELGDRSWKLSLGDGVRAPSRCTVAAGDTTAVLMAIAKAKARCHLAVDSLVRSCYEAGRDGFWLHRWLSGQGIANLVVDPASIEVNRRARRAKTDRLDSDSLATRLAEHLGKAVAFSHECSAGRSTAHAGSGAFGRHRARRIFGTRMIMPIAARALRQTAVVSVVLFKY